MDLALARVRATKLLRLSTKRDLWPVARQGVVPALEHAHVPFSASYDVIVDVGASRGQFAWFAADRWPAARLICFEPLPDAQATLRAMLGDRITLHPAAVSDAAGQMELHVSASDDSSSLLAIGSRQVAEFPGTQETGTISVNVVRLSDVLDPADLGSNALLKIDVQGAELSVLRGAGDLLGAVADVYCECSFVELYDGQALFGDIVCFLRDQGFRVASVDNVARGAGGEALQADVLFRRVTQAA